MHAARSNGSRKHQRCRIKAMLLVLGSYWENDAFGYMVYNNNRSKHISLL